MQHSTKTKRCCQSYFDPFTLRVMLYQDVISFRITDLDKLNLVKIQNGGQVSGSSQFPLMPRLPQKMTLASKVVKNDSKITILFHYSKSVTHSVWTFSNLKRRMNPMTGSVGYVSHLDGIARIFIAFKRSKARPIVVQHDPTKKIIKL